MYRISRIRNYSVFLRCGNNLLQETICARRQLLIEKTRSLSTCEKPHWIRSFSQSQKDFLTQEVSKFDSSIPVEEAITPPSSWYTNPLFYELEKLSVFRNNWFAVGRLDQVDRTGKFFTGTLGDEPYIVTRDANDELRGFFNVCRHHATVVMEDEEGEAKNFECPYHGWTYNLDGRLTKATRLRGIKDFKATDYGLKSVKVQSWGPIVFIKLNDDDNGPTLEDKLVNLKKELDATGFSDALQFVKRQHYDIECNWKVFIDNFLDGGYHIEYAHKELNALLSVGSYKSEIYDGYSVQETSGNSKNLRIGSNKVIYAHIFPNGIINRYGPWLDVNYVIPKSHDSCVVTIDWFLEKDVIKSCDDTKLGNLIGQGIKDSNKVQMEDIEICHRVQKGLKSMSYHYGRYAPNVEAPDHDFHQRIAENFKTYLKKEEILID